MAASRIDNTNLFTQSRTNITALLDSRTNVNDPAAGSAQHRKFVFARRPDMKDLGFRGYPFIVVHPSDIEVVSENQSVDMKSRFVSWVVEVEIVASDRGHGNRDGKGLSDLDAISDDVMETLLGKTNRETLAGNGLWFFEVSAGSADTELIQNELTFVRSIIVNFKTRMQVSA